MNYLKRYSLFSTLIAMFLSLVAALPIVAQAQSVCTQTGTVTLPASSAPYFFTQPFTVQNGQTVTLSVTGSAAFQSGFIPGPGGGSDTTFTNNTGSPIVTQAAIIAPNGGTFTWTLGGACPVSVPTTTNWALLVMAALLLVAGGVVVRRGRAQAA